MAEEGTLACPVARPALSGGAVSLFALFIPLKA